jgi:hypothetical protein
MYCSILERLLCNFFFFVFFVFFFKVRSQRRRGNSSSLLLLRTRDRSVRGMHNIARFFSALLSDLRTDPHQES